MDWQANPEAAREFTRFYQTAWKLIDGQILVHGAGVDGRPGLIARWRLRRALSLFDRALEIHPGSWQSLWGKGKIYQRLGDSRQAYWAFVAAHKLAPDEADVAREGAVAAIELGDTKAALGLTEAAIKANPEDPGLVSNLALAYLLDGEPDEAQRYIEEALRRDPSDAITVTLHVVIREVVNGERDCPRSLADLNKNL